MPAQTHAITRHEANCLAAADHFIACRRSKPATRIRVRFDRIAAGDPRRGDWPSQYACFLDQPEARSHPRFNALIYSADTLIPVVSLEMQAYWLPDDDTGRGAWARAYLWLHIAMGWGLTLLEEAGFSGLIKQDSK